MTKSRLFPVVVLATMVTLLAFGQLAAAQARPHFQIKLIPKQVNSDHVNSNPAPPNGLYGIDQAFVVTPLPDGSNSDGSDLWPCFGDTSSPNVDCPTIGNPSITFPNGGIVIGSPQYVWSYAACDGNAATVGPCGQTETWYEDDSNDSLATDDLTYLIEVTQGANVISDSGTVDFGPNPYGGLSPAADVIIYGDQNFGTLGQTGKNNGNCSADFNYPSPVLPGVFVVAANKTCVDPKPGLATLSATTSIATAKFTTVKGVTTVKYTVKYKVLQKWNIFLQ